MASPLYNDAKYFIISYIACRYTCLKKHNRFSFIALLFVPRLFLHELPGAIGMLKAGVRVYGVVRYYNCHPSAIQHLRDCYQATRAVSGRHRPGQLRMVADIKTATNVDISTIFASTISFSAGYQHCQGNSRAPRVICFRFLIKIFYYNNFKSCPITRQISNCSFRIKGYSVLID